MTDELKTLQDGLAASIRTILQAYDQCTAPDMRAQLIDQAQMLSSQMSQIETTLFHQQTLEASATLAAAFASAKGFTDQIDKLNNNLEKVSDIISLAGKVINTVTQIVNVLPA
jgi:flagellar hook-associated protein FlgK